MFGLIFAFLMTGILKQTYKIKIYVINNKLLKTIVNLPSFSDNTECGFLANEAILSRVHKIFNLD